MTQATQLVEGENRGN